jgi:hypothetical protein
VSEWSKISVDCCFSWHIILIPLKQQYTDILLHSDILYWFHWNNSLQISCSTLTHYTDSTETRVYRYLGPLWHIILTPLKQQSTDILLHSDTLYWFHWNNSLQISCSTLTHYTDSTETTVYRYLVPLWHIILTPLKQQSTDILVHSDTLYWFHWNKSTDILLHSDTLYWFHWNKSTDILLHSRLHWNNSLQISCSTLTHYTDSIETTVYR